MNSNKIILFTDSAGIDYKLEINYPHSISFIFNNNHYSGFDRNSAVETMWVLQKIENNSIKWSERSWWILPPPEVRNYFDSVFQKYIDNKIFW